LSTLPKTDGMPLDDIFLFVFENWADCAVVLMVFWSGTDNYFGFCDADGIFFEAIGFGISDLFLHLLFGNFNM
jgi:hypothetical protein